MKLSKLALVAAIACGTYAGNVFADQPNEIRLVSCDCGEPVCGCEAACDTSDCCDSGCDSCGCDSGCCLGGLDCLSCLGCGDCCLGDPYTLFGEHCGWSAGGWGRCGGGSANGDVEDFNIIGFIYFDIPIIGVNYRVEIVLAAG